MRATIEKEAKFAAATEWYRRLWLPGEVARRHATMRRHLEDPVQGWSSFPMRSSPSRYVGASNSTRVMREDEAAAPRGRGAGSIVLPLAR